MKKRLGCSLGVSQRTDSCCSRVKVEPQAHKTTRRVPKVSWTQEWTPSELDESDPAPTSEHAWAHLWTYFSVLCESSHLWLYVIVLQRGCVALIRSFKGLLRLCCCQAHLLITFPVQLFIKRLLDGELIRVCAWHFASLITGHKMLPLVGKRVWKL